MIWSIITHILTIIVGGISGWSLHCLYISKKKNHIGDNAVSNGGVIATNGSNIANVGNVVNNYNIPATKAPQITLSNQAKRILVEFLDSNQTLLIYFYMSTSQREIRQLSLQGKSIEIDEQNIDADMSDLVEAGYLKLESSSRDTKKYEWTHNGREYAKMLSKANIKSQ